ncbi:acyl-ACP desaturase [Nocardia seriolae]|uniref:Stearoyl-[acyl-carrier-protein] 9-desaturase n=2 Tax=Nocardia seriolae TaxID=37332 RepID=A0ABC8AY70_9NOCA|nr:acyl-ACP desaturase [Nocardia seriolae]APA99345.1 Stearoyl-[acyl-carrier-protein] 9-desaturase [Nocardia seriolae]MTJ63267.1 acyl-ACP desaturase [Nocardia seriolae]MTJ71143.1 acyl-ACP desaturase [Nocardia seriolae]MTJ88932.1 acyl-ACP desaturase [Nocardia seriolae]MTK41159.1 acyl-ACP desaturase [Nocardia seriolae]
MTMESSLLPVGELVAAVDGFLAASPAARAWDVETAFDWATADAGRLTEGQRSAVRFVTFIEDHLPGYFDVYQRFFPVDDSVDRPAFIHNRELYHFTVRWALEEDTHARALNHYQVASGIAERDSLRAELAVEGQKPFDLPYRHPVQFFAYALVQEKATQMYYHQLREVAADPVLAAVLSRLARDEARHFSFMADVVSRYLRVQGDEVVEPIREVIAGFRMPLADTMRGYWRWAFRIADVADYDHTAAYEHLLRVLDRAVDARTDRLDELADFIGQCRALG